MKHQFPKTFSTIRTFSYLPVTEIAEHCKEQYPFTERTLCSMMATSKTQTATPNINVLEGVAKLYGVSAGYWLDAVPNGDICYGFIDEEQGGVVAYLIAPVLRKLVAYLAEFHPTDGLDDDEWEAYEERGWSYDFHKPMSEALKLGANRAAVYPVSYRGVVVGFAITPETADWLKAHLLACAKHCLGDIDKRVHKRLLAPWRSAEG